MKAAIDTLNSDKQIIEQNLKGSREIIKNYERQSLEYNSEMAKMKGEIVKMRNEKELHAIR